MLAKYEIAQDAGMPLSIICCGRESSNKCTEQRLKPQEQGVILLEMLDWDVTGNGQMLFA